jgi:hypothetical protein
VQDLFVLDEFGTSTTQIVESEANTSTDTKTKKVRGPVAKSGHSWDN